SSARDKERVESQLNKYKIFAVLNGREILEHLLLFPRFQYERRKWREPANEKALEARMDETSAVLATEKGLEAKYEAMSKLLEKEQSLREETQRTNRLIERELNETRARWKSEVEVLQKKLSNALANGLDEGIKAQDFEDRLKREKSAREQIEKKLHMLEEELKKGTPWKSEV
ncbi:unnamed protein product, partial [Darwinula stevensoni]